MTSKLQSDVTYDFQSFLPENYPSSTKQLNNILIQKRTQDPQWWEVGPITYRNLRKEGKTAFPPAIKLGRTTEISVPSSESGRSISCCVITPSEGRESKGVYLHFHGGGFVMGGADQQDLLLTHIADEVGLTAVSVEYRLSPEHAYPAGLDDCKDVADWMVKNAREKFGCDLTFLGGESAGATLTAQVLLHLRTHHPDFLPHLKGSVLNYGCFDLSILPSAHLSTTTTTPILGYEDIARFFSIYIPYIPPNEAGAGFKSSALSPAYNDLEGLGDALFLVGTEDALLDDTVLMHWRWRRAGNEGVLKFVPGAPHGFMLFDGRSVKCARESWGVMVSYLRERV